MTPEQWRLISSAFHGALAQPPEGRQAFLNDACGADAGVREEVERLLRANQNAGAFGDAPVAALSGSVPALDAPANAPLAGTVSPAAASDAHTKSTVAFIALTWLMAIGALAAFTNAGWILIQQRGTTTWMGWETTPRGGEWYINSVVRAGPAAEHLKMGDRLVSLNGTPPVADAGIHFARGLLTMGEAYDVVVERDGQVLHHRLVVAGRPNTGTLVYFAVSLVWCAVGLFIGFARPDSVLARLCCLTAVAVGLVFLQVGVIHGGPLWQPLHTVLGFHFLARFPTGLPTRGVWKWALRAAYASGAFAAALGLLTTGTLLLTGAEQTARLMNEFASLTELRRPAGWLSFMIAVAGMVLVLPYNYRRLENDDQRRRVRWVLYAGLVALVPQLWWAAVNALELFVGPPGVSRLDLFANAFTGVIPLAMAYAVLKHRVLDIKVVIRRGVQYLLARRALQVLTALPFIALIYTVVSNRHLTLEQLLTQTGGYLFWLAVAAVTLRFRTPIRLWLDRRFFREELDRERLMLKMLDDSRRVGSLHELSRLVSETLTAAMHPSRAYVWYRDPQELASTAASSPLLAPSDFPSSERWLSWLEQRGATPLPVPLDAGLSQDDMHWLERRGIDLIVPIADSDDRLVGALLLGEKKSEQPYNDGDSRFLNAVAKQAAMIRENLRLRARLTEEVRVRHDVLARLDGTMPDLLKECPACGACFSGDIKSCPVDQQFLTLTLPVPRTIDTRYRLDRLIGKGGMGAVYEACDLRLDRVVALKIMLSRAFGQPGALRRFRREARTAARLSHPNIVAVFDVGSLEGEGAYIVMERIQGTTLRAAIERQCPMPHAELADWFDPLLNGIAAAHARGIIHRDLKPENVMGCRDASGTLAVKILDLGLVKLRADELMSGTMTAEGVIMGTPDYMSPEQLFGHDVDHRSDIFALGVMLLEALTGHRAIRGEQRIRSLTPELHQVIARCLAADPAERPASATVLRKELSVALRDSLAQRA